VDVEFFSEENTNPRACERKVENKPDEVLAGTLYCTAIQRNTKELAYTTHMNRDFRLHAQILLGIGHGEESLPKQHLVTTYMFQDMQQSSLPLLSISTSVPRISLVLSFSIPVIVQADVCGKSGRTG
jgi:hypothetical protein